MSALARRAADGRRTRSKLGRPAVAALCGAVVTALLPLSTASAAPLSETSTRVVVRGCTGPAVAGVTASLDGSWTDGNAFDSTLALYEDGVLIAHEDPEFTSADWDGSVLRGRFTLLDADPGAESGPIGTADFALTLVPTGESTSETSRWRDGNAAVRETAVSQPVEVSDGGIAVSLEGRELVFDVSGCTGSATTTLRVTSQPDTTVRREPADILAQCDAGNADGDLLFADLSSDDGPHVAVVVVSDGQEIFGSESVDFSRPPQPVQVSIPLLREMAGELVPAGTAAVELISERTGRTSTTLVYQGGRDRFSTTFYRLDGTISVDGLAPFSIVGCEGYVTTSLQRTSSPSGPADGGPVPSNDEPEEAAELTLGAPGVNVQTRSAAEPLDAPMSCEIPSENGTLAPGHSVWFRFTGTGGPVALDPSGSSFNTVLAVYRQEGDRLVEIACLDDLLGGTNPTTQPVLTVGTAEGVSYFVQAAGFAQQSGRLRLAAAPG